MPFSVSIVWNMKDLKYEYGFAAIELNNVLADSFMWLREGSF